MRNKIFIGLSLLFMGCQTVKPTETVNVKELNQRINAIEFEAIFAYYNHNIDMCLIQGEICFLKKGDSCQEKQEKCVLKVDAYWQEMKKKKGWK